MADKKRTFEAMSGGDQGAVDYFPLDDPTSTPLPMPQEGDTLEEVGRKIHVLAQIIDAGTSMAVHTEFTGITHTEPNPVLIAKAQMRPREREMYEAWAQGEVMPPIDWDRCTKGIPEDAGSAARFATHATALDIIYNRAGTTPGNAAYFFAEFHYAIPLVTAVSRIEGAKRDIRGDQELEMAEIQTLACSVNVAADMAEKVVNDAIATVTQLFRDVNRAKETLRKRERAIKAKLPGYKPRHGNANQACGSVQRPTVYASINFRAGTAGSHHARTSFPVGTDMTAPGRQAAYEERTAAVAARGGREVREGAPHVPDEVEGGDNVV